MRYRYNPNSRGNRALVSFSRLSDGLTHQATVSDNSEQAEDEHSHKDRFKAITLRISAPELVQNVKQGFIHDLP